MTTPWMDELLVNLTLEETKYDVFNTKEDAEVLKGLFIGRYAHQQFKDIHTLKQLKMWDIL